MLDDVSLRALEQRAQARPDDPGYPAMPAAYGNGTPGSPGGDQESPGALLWLALCVAPPEGVGIADLMDASGMYRTTLYRHLIEHARAGRAVQVSRGRWRAAFTGEAGPG